MPDSDIGCSFFLTLDIYRMVPDGFFITFNIFLNWVDILRCLFAYGVITVSRKIILVSSLSPWDLYLFLFFHFLLKNIPNSISYPYIISKFDHFSLWFLLRKTTFCPHLFMTLLSTHFSWRLFLIPKERFIASGLIFFRTTTAITFSSKSWFIFLTMIWGIILIDNGGNSIRIFNRFRLIKWFLLGSLLSI